MIKAGDIKYIYLYINPLRGNSHVIEPMKVKFINGVQFFEIDENNERILSFKDSYDPEPDNLAPIQDLNIFSYKIFDNYETAIKSFAAEEIKRSEELVKYYQEKLFEAMREEVILIDKYSNIDLSYKYRKRKRPSFIKETTSHFSLENSKILEIEDILNRSKNKNIVILYKNIEANEAGIVFKINLKYLEDSLKRKLSKVINLKTESFLIITKI